MLNFKMINIARTTKTIGDLVTSFWRTEAVVTSRFAARTLTDFLAKAGLLDRDANLICRYFHNGCIYKQIAKRCVLLGYGLIR